MKQVRCLTYDNIFYLEMTMSIWLTGYYRVNYDARNWHLIAKQLMTNHTAISVINRAQIMNDALNLARAGLLVYEVPLNLTKYLEREEEFLPWEATLTALSYLDSMMKRTPGYGLLKVNSKWIKYWRTVNN